jgi:hypothetical protein
MNAKYANLPGATDGIVYVRAIAVADLPDDLQSEIEGLDTVYSVHRPDGVRVALVANKAIAFAIARQNDLAPVSVH